MLAHLKNGVLDRQTLKDRATELLRRMSGVTQLYGHVITIIGEEKYPSCTLFFYGADKPERKRLQLITERLPPGSAERVLGVQEIIS